jgi:hypothetical protein
MQKLINLKQKNSIHYYEKATFDEGVIISPLAFHV